jgi:hypothetical protein
VLIFSTSTAVDKSISSAYIYPMTNHGNPRMNHVPLAEFAKGKTQQEVGDFIGCSQSAVHQMLNSDRKIFVVPDAKSIADRMFEIKKPGSKKSAAN